MTQTHDHLNPEQRRAVEHIHGPLLIVAGAGTGKTTLVVEKIKHIIEDKLAKPDEILALTFTEKAAAEMEERVDKALPYGYFQTWLATFHSFADQILRAQASHIGLDAGYKLLTQIETIMFIRANLFTFDLKYFRPLGNPQKFIEALLQHFSRLRDEDISPTQYLQWAEADNAQMSSEEKQKNLELAHTYIMFQELKIKASYFDFADLIYYTLELFRKRPHILAEYRKRFNYILVDEFQDTNIAQYVLIKLLCPPKNKPNLTVVGDDSQAIYKFRGASVSNILTFMNDYPSAAQVTLNKNYRSNQAILDVSYRLIKHNDPDTLEAQLGISKELVAQKKANPKAVNFVLAAQISDEVDHVVQTINELRKKTEYTFSDFAILVRANSHVDAFVTGLARAGIPYAFLGPSMLFKQPEVKDLIAYLKVLANPEDSPSFYRILSLNTYRMDAQELSLLVAFAKKIAAPLYQAVHVINSLNSASTKSGYEIYRKYLPQFDACTLATLQSLQAMIKNHLMLVKRESAGQILYAFLEDTGRLKDMTSYQTTKEESVVLNIAKFFEKLKAFEAENADTSIYAALEYIEMSLELGESPTGDQDRSTYDAVNILTIHGAKGLEFPVVFLVNLSQGRFPTTEKKEPIPIPQELIKEILPQGDYHVEEERRLFYVALTRAQDYVYLSASLYYGEGKRERKISPFVAETIGLAEVEKHKAIKKEEKEQLSIFDFKPAETPIIKLPLTLSNFSFTQLDSFELCPLRYKYQYILKIPTPTNAAASFGESIHKTLQYFYQEYMHDHALGLPRLLAIFNEVWIPLGYTSATHMAKHRHEGEKMLQNFFAAYHTPHIEPISLEKLFKIKIDNGIFVTGKIDRVDKKGLDEIEIIDYKTGKKPDEKELKKSLQLSIYAIAASDPQLFRKPLTKVNLTFYYLQDLSKFTMQRTAAEMVEVKEKIISTVARIRSDNFQPKVGRHCDFCPFRMICEAW